MTGLAEILGIEWKRYVLGVSSNWIFCVVTHCFRRAPENQCWDENHGFCLRLVRFEMFLRNPSRNIC